MTLIYTHCIKAEVISAIVLEDSPMLWGCPHRAVLAVEAEAEEKARLV